MKKIILLTICLCINTFAYNQTQIDWFNENDNTEYCHRPIRPPKPPKPVNLDTPIIFILLLLVSVLSYKILKNNKNNN